MAGKPGTPGRRGPRPDMWKTGPDPILHEQYRAWGRHRAQAHFRGEDYQLTFDDWCWVWLGQWHRRGRCRGDLMMTRVDWRQPWNRENCMLVTRQTHVENQVRKKFEQGKIGNIWIDTK